MIDELADRIARNREIAGLHFESDSKAGENLAQSLFDVLSSNALPVTVPQPHSASGSPAVDGPTLPIHQSRPRRWSGREAEQCAREQRVGGQPPTKNALFDPLVTSSTRASLAAQLNPLPAGFDLLDPKLGVGDFLRLGLPPRPTDPAALRLWREMIPPGLKIVLPLAEDTWATTSFAATWRSAGRPCCRPGGR